MLGTVTLGSFIAGSYFRPVFAQTYNPAAAGHIVFSTAPVLAWNKFPTIGGARATFGVAASHICKSGPWPVSDAPASEVWAADGPASDVWSSDAPRSGSWVSDPGRSGC